MPDQKPPPDPSCRSPFLSLPPELRHIIYSYAVNPIHDYFSTYDLPSIRACRQAPPSSRHKFLIGSDDEVGLDLQEPDGLHSLILLNRQIHHEMMDWFPKSREIRCNELNSFAQLLLAREEEGGSVALRDIRRISVVVNRVAQTLVFHPNTDLEHFIPDEEEDPEDLEISGVSRGLLKRFTRHDIVRGEAEGASRDERREFGEDFNAFGVSREGVERHFHYYGLSYLGFRERVSKLRLREFTVTILCSEVLEVDGAGFMDVLSADARGLIEALPVGLGDGGVWRMIVHGFKSLGEEDEGDEGVVREMGGFCLFFSFLLLLLRMAGDCADNVVKVCESFYSTFERRGDRLVEEDDVDGEEAILLSDVGMKVDDGDEDMDGEGGDEEQGVSDDESGDT